MISVIVLTWNSERYIRKCLEFLLADLRKAKRVFEIFVVDNDSQDNTREILEEFKAKGLITVILLKENTGTTYSRNIALKRAKGEFVLILDSDTKVLPGAIEAMVRVLNDNPHIGILAPELQDAKEIVQRSYKKFPTVALKILKTVPFGFVQKIGVRMESYSFLPESTKLYPVDYCISACWLVPRHVIESVGLFDEHIFYAPEDVDYCLRVWLAGFQVVYMPNAKVIHHTQRVSYRNKKIAFEHAKGLVYCFRKHGYWISREKVYRVIQRVTNTRYPIYQ